MGTFIEKCFGFYQVREELEARISELEDENENLTNENTRLLASKEWLTTEKIELIERNQNITKANTDLKTEKENLNNQLDASQMQVNDLKNSHQVLENEKAELLKEKENLTKEKTDLEREMARLKSLEATDKSELDLQNWRFKSAIEDLKRQNRKLEEENIALKERVDSLKEQPSKQPKPY